ncbi:MAG TPA: cytidine deaminase [Jiangellaceae bacterium]
MSGLSDEDSKLVTLARATRARTGAAEGAAVRDGDGRTYAAASVALPSLTLSALQVAVAMAVSSGATSLEAAAVVADAGADRFDGEVAGTSAVREMAGAGVPVIIVGPDGSAVASAVT